MNLVPVNKPCRSLGADVCTLPTVTGLGAIIVGKRRGFGFELGGYKMLLLFWNTPGLAQDHGVWEGSSFLPVPAHCMNRS